MLRLCTGHADSPAFALKIDAEGWRVGLFASDPTAIALSVARTSFPCAPTMEMLLEGLPNWPVMLVAFEQEPLRIYWTDLDDGGHCGTAVFAPLHRMKRLAKSWRRTRWGAQLPADAVDATVWALWAFARAQWPETWGAVSEANFPKLPAVKHVQMREPVAASD